MLLILNTVMMSGHSGTPYTE